MPATCGPTCLSIHQVPVLDPFLPLPGPPHQERGDTAGARHAKYFVSARQAGRAGTCLRAGRLAWSDRTAPAGMPPPLVLCPPSRSSLQGLCACNDSLQAPAGAAADRHAAPEQPARALRPALLPVPRRLHYLPALRRRLQPVTAQGGLLAAGRRAGGEWKAALVLRRLPGNVPSGVLPRRRQPRVLVPP